MTMTAEFASGPAGGAAPAAGGPAIPHEVTSAPWGYVIAARKAEGRAMRIVRLAAGALGVAALLGAGALWLAPGAVPAPDARPMTLAGSASLLMLGVWLLTLGRERGALEAQVDHRRAEVRVMLRMRSGAARLLARHGFQDLAEIAVEGDALVLTGQDGRRLLSRRLGT
ncbi:hypothetical protein BCF33_0999 [Hasllibacter halocynthiae]|uniref:Uncharacterized protein n=1 Tax=Hasllibacter halocynthiae TaxID=595589 RepID=A0A2T0X8V8_9RHOB|nr:hypothetical protein [Hasllibacter halocynthiae]PRY95381.1 hypothetical protein BCF33_0999 [Hasllibacter halocynthiae]